MPARVQVIVEARDAASGVLRGITSQLGTFGSLIEEVTSKNVSWGNVAQMATQMVVSGIKDAIKVTTQYAGEVRDLAAVSGTSAEEASRMLQVLDDFEISAQDATAATRALTKQGLAPTVETLADLSEQYLAINDPMERNKFIIENLGRAGLQWVNVLKQGKNAILDMNAGVDENLILTDEQIKRTEEYRLAMDDLQDTIMGWKVAAVTSFMDANDALGNAREGLLAYGNSVDEVNTMFLQHSQRVQQVSDDYARASAYGSAWADALAKEVTPAVEDLTIATDDISRANTGLLGLMGSLQSETDRYREKQSSLRQEMALLKQEYFDGNIKQEEYKQKVQEITGAMRENELAHIQAGNAIAFSLLQQKMAVNGLSDAEFKALTSIGVKWGIFEQDIADAALAMDTAAANIATNAGEVDESLKDPVGKLVAFNEKVEAAAKKSGMEWNYTFNVITRGSIPNLPELNQANQAAVQNCFLAGTSVTMADGTQKPIEYIQLGDMVLSFDLEWGGNIPAKVTETFSHGEQEGEGYYIILNKRISVTDNHQLMTVRGWAAVRDLRLNDLLFTVDGKLEAVTSLERVNARVKTYNLHVDDENHNYFAGGILAHNKQQGGPVFAGSRYNINEAGQEVFIPGVNGRILSHSEALAAMQAGGVNGGTYNFYGNVTLLLGEENASGLMEIR